MVSWCKDEPALSWGVFPQDLNIMKKRVQKIKKETSKSPDSIKNDMLSDRPDNKFQDRRFSWMIDFDAF